MNPYNRYSTCVDSESIALSRPDRTRPRAPNADNDLAIEIWEDVIEEERIAVYEDDINPPERSDREPLSGVTTNLLGIDYGTELEFDEDEFDENARSYKLNETIGGEILEPDDNGMKIAVVKDPL